MRVPIELARALAATLAIGATMSSCTLFDGLVADGGYLEVPAAARLCARIFDCPTLGPSIQESLGIPADDRSFSTCVSWFAGPVPPLPFGVAAPAQVLSAMAGAKSCSEALSHAGTEVLADDDPICAGGADACDDGHNILLDCHARRRVRCDDPLFGEGSACDLGGQKHFGRCQVSDCPLGTGLAGLPNCSGNTLTFCDHGSDATQSFHCDALGLTCASISVGDHMMGVGICSSSTPQAGACDSDLDGASCAGTAVVLCNRKVDIQIPGASTATVAVALLQPTFDCSKLGWECVRLSGTGPGTAHCKRPGAECTPDDAAALCDGQTLTVCLAGRKTQVDCAAGGMVCRDRTSGSARGASCTFAGGG